MTEISTQVALIEFQCQIIREQLEHPKAEDLIQTESLQQFVDSLPDSNLFEVVFFD